MDKFFRDWEELHFAILYAFLFAVQIFLFATGRKKKKDLYWISLIILQILSILLVIYGNYSTPGLLSFPNNFFSSLVAIPVYGIFFFVTLAKRSSMNEMAGVKIWQFLLIGSFVAVTLVPAILTAVKTILRYL